MTEIFLSIIIPAYNEERRLGATLLELADYLKTAPWPVEVIIISDGSRDKTASLALTFQNQLPNLTVLDNKVNQGKGGAVRDGMLVAKGKFCLFMDADGATKIEEVEKLLPHLPDNQVVIGSIGIKGSRMVRKESGLRILAGTLGNALIRFLLLPGIYDTQRGFKLFTREAAQIIFPKLTVLRWGFDIELLVLARSAGYKIKEVPIIWQHIDESKVNPFSYLQVFREVLVMKLKQIKK